WFPKSEVVPQYPKHHCESVQFEQVVWVYWLKPAVVQELKDRLPLTLDHGRFKELLLAVNPRVSPVSITPSTQGHYRCHPQRSRDRFQAGRTERLFSAAKDLDKRLQ